MRMIVVVMLNAGRQRQKDAGHLLEGDAFAGEKLQHSGIFHHTHGAGQHFDAEMEIAEPPRDSRRLFHGRNRNFQHPFRYLLDYIVIVADGKKVGAMIDRLGEIEAEFLPVLGHAAPAPFRESGAIDPQQHMAMMPVNSVRVRIILDDGQVGHGRFRES